MMHENNDKLLWDKSSLIMLERHLHNFQRLIDERRKDYRENRKKIEVAESKCSLKVSLQTLISKNTEITNELAKLQAELETQKNFQKSIQNGLCPILSQKCLNLGDDETLESFVKSQFSKLTTKIRKLEKEKVRITSELTTAFEAEKFSIVLELYRTREIDIINEGKRLKTEIESINRQIAELRFATNSTNYQIQQPVTQITPQNKNICNVGSMWLKFAEFFFSAKTCGEVFYPLVGDWQEEYVTALAKGRIFLAISICVRNYFSFLYTMLKSSKLWSFVEFIFSAIGILEFLSQIFKFK